MSELTEKCKSIISELESNIKDQNTLDFAKSQVYELLSTFLTEVEKIQENADKKIEQLIQNQSKLDIRLSNIEKDIYEEDSDFEITCPYCNHEFLITDEDLEDEIICPECNNAIELDWNDEKGCSGCLGGCKNGCDCSEDEEDNYDNEDDM